MFSFLKLFKKRELDLIESYTLNGLDVRIKVDQEGKKVVELISSTPNRKIEIEKEGTVIKHKIYDAHDGAFVVEIPISLYQKIME